MPQPLKGDLIFKRLAVSLKRYPDTKRAAGRIARADTLIRNTRLAVSLEPIL